MSMNKLIFFKWISSKVKSFVACITNNTKIDYFYHNRDYFIMNIKSTEYDTQIIRPAEK